MIRRFSFTLFAILSLVAPALAGIPGGLTPITMYGGHNRAARWHNANTQWHGNYAHVQWRQPVALIVPPNANMQTSYSWGVGRTRMVPIYHQFTRPYVAPGSAGSTLLAPNWPASTTEQGVYSIRGPW